ncbi:MAG: hypothetical protein KKB31_07160 [Nanoarchaeota archaeon]|nr:hypothetical protein [Nanoarchaeota archaeon]
MFIRKAGDGNWYVCKTIYGRKTRGVGRRVKKLYRNWFLIKFKGNNWGQLNTKNITIPEELVGKRIRLKVEII